MKSKQKTIRDYKLALDSETTEKLEKVRKHYGFKNKIDVIRFLTTKEIRDERI